MTEKILGVILGLAMVWYLFKFIRWFWRYMTGPTDDIERLFR